SAARRSSILAELQLPRPLLREETGSVRAVRSEQFPAMSQEEENPMKSWNRKTSLAVAATLLIAAGATRSWGAPANTKTEVTCQSTITKAVAKHVAAVAA